jgi:hypothetical protein
MLVMPALRDALRANPSPEQRRRLDALLIPAGKTPRPRGEELRGVRAVEVLARLPDSRPLLEALAGGASPSWTTRAARAALTPWDNQAP